MEFTNSSMEISMVGNGVMDRVTELGSRAAPMAAVTSVNSNVA